MSREDRRRFEREFKKIPKGDNCSICGKAFPHNSRTFGGLNDNGKATLAGECCRHRLSSVMVSGLYVTQAVDLLTSLGKPGGKNTAAKPVNVDQALTVMQSMVSSVGAQADVLMSRAGMQHQPRGVFLGEHAWKTEDAAWFKDHPDRSHRLRPARKDEFDTPFGGVPKEEMAPNHEVHVLIRQVEPGKRIRRAFALNMQVTVPDQEEIIHAIFDAVAVAAEGEIIDIRRIVEQAEKYATSRAGPLN